MPVENSALQTEKRAVLPPARRWTFRLILLILVSVVPLGALELSLRLGGYGFEPGFLIEKAVNGRRMFIDNPKFGLRFFPPRLARTPPPLLVAAEKPGGVTRLVVLGESAAYGDPEPAFGLPRVLEVLLQEQFPSRRFEVVNAAMTAIDSHALREIARDIRRLQPDGVVIYAGNNEVVGPFGPGSAVSDQSGSWRWVRAGLWVRSFRTGQLLDALAQRWGDAGDAAGATEWGGLEMFLSRQVGRDDPQLESLRVSFRKNLEDILQILAGTPVILATPVVNLRDCAPMGSGEIATAARHIFVDAQQHLRRGDREAATRGFHAARIADPLRFRADAGLADIVRQLAKSSQTTLVDAELEFARASSDGIPGAEFFWEHVHFNEAGNHLLATFIAQGIAAGILTNDSAQLRSWVGTNEVARVLGLTDWHRSRMIERIRARLTRPPFRDQDQSAERDAELARRLKLLAPARLIAGFEPQAALCRAAIARRTNDWMLRVQFAEMLAGFGDREGAVGEWRHVTTQMPHHLMAHYHLGRLLATEPRHATAAELELRAALALREDFPEAWEQLGQALGQQQRFAEADAAFARAIDLRPTFTDARANRALTQQAAGETNAALFTLRDAVTRDSNSVLACGRYAALLAGTGQFAAAAEAWERVLRLRPTAEAYIQAARAWEAATNVLKAGPHWASAVTLNPDHAEARMGLGLALAQTGQFVLAADHFRELIRHHPDAAGAHLNLGITLMAQDKPADALTAFERALALEPGSGKARDYVQTLQRHLQSIKNP